MLPHTYQQGLPPQEKFRAIGGEQHPLPIPLSPTSLLSPLTPSLPHFPHLLSINMLYHLHVKTTFSGRNIQWEDLLFICFLVMVGSQIEFAPSKTFCFANCFKLLLLHTLIVLLSTLSLLMQLARLKIRTSKFGPARPRPVCCS